jgi:ribose 5-phosphate isomerase A
MDEPKRRAAEAAADRVESGMIVGLGTGSTAAFAIEAIGRRLSSGDLRDVVGVPTSIQTTGLARTAGIPLTTLDDHPLLDLTIDGADEVDPSGNLIKGGGGALLWEKIVATASEHYIIVVDETKLVDLLGEFFAVPVEVMPFGWRTHLGPLGQLGGEPVLRINDGGEPFVTDGSHYIIDCRFPGGIPDPVRIHGALRSRPGVVETGLFLGMDPEIIVGRSEQR